MDKLINFRIDHIDPLGQGVFKSGECIYFISKTLPGETGKAQITSNKKKIHFGYPNDLIETSPKRMAPACPHYDNCTSCSFLHTDYDNELNFKLLSLKKHLQKCNISDELYTIHKADHRFEYRNRIQLHYNLTTNKFGFISRKLNTIINVDNCKIVRPEILNKLHEISTLGIRQFISTTQKQKKGHIEISFYNNKINININRSYSNDGFTQVNQIENKKLLELIKNKSLELNLSNAKIIDLFGGNGNLTKLLSRSNVFVFDKYNANPTNNDFQSFFNIDLFKEDSLDKITKICNKPKLVMLDPPRSGHKHLYNYIEKLSPRFIFYISCNPATLARDILKLDGYKIISIHLFDFFPGTYHFETFCILKKINR